jgi:hypothetical protein
MTTKPAPINPFTRIKDSRLKEMLLKFERGALAEGINVSSLVKELGNSLISMAEKTKPQPEYKPRKSYSRRRVNDNQAP